MAELKGEKKVGKSAGPLAELMVAMKGWQRAE